MKVLLQVVFALLCISKVVVGLDYSVSGTDATVEQQMMKVGEQLIFPIMNIINITELMDRGQECQNLSTSDLHALLTKADAAAEDCHLKNLALTLDDQMKTDCMKVVFASIKKDLEDLAPSTVNCLVKNNISINMEGVPSLVQLTISVVTDAVKCLINGKTTSDVSIMPFSADIPPVPVPMDTQTPLPVDMDAAPAVVPLPSVPASPAMVPVAPAVMPVPVAAVPAFPASVPTAPAVPSSIPLPPPAAPITVQ